MELIKKHFNKKNPLTKIFNRNTIKISYSCTKNMKAIIQGHNTKIINNNAKAVNTVDNKQCNCRKRACPLNGKCLASKCVIYQATVQCPNKEDKKYVGLTEGDFKTRFTGHVQSFNDPCKKSASAMAKYVWEENLQPEPNIRWEILKHTVPYKPGNKDCDLCLSEKFAIMNVSENKNYLNKRSEIKKLCPHK